MSLVGCLWMLSRPALAADMFPADPAPDRLTIVTWNLEWFFDDNLGDNQSKTAKEESSPNASFWNWKRDAIAEAIAKMRPNIIALQEIEGKTVLHALTDTLRNKHNQTYRIAFVEGFDGSTEQDVGILYQSGCVEYSRREQNNAMFKSGGFYSLSKHLFARFEWETGNHTESMTMLTMHLRAREEAAKEREKQARLVHQLLKKQIEAGENVVVLGDTNFDGIDGKKTTNDDGAEALSGRQTNSKDDDLIDLNSKLPANQRRTHLVADKQFDRIFVSQAMIENDPSVKDWVFERIEVLPNAVIRGNDPVQDHWEKRFKKPPEQRELSDHFPVMATFVLK